MRSTYLTYRGTDCCCFLSTLLYRRSFTGGFNEVTRCEIGVINKTEKKTFDVSKYYRELCDIFQNIYGMMSPW